MALNKFIFRPGINREGTDYDNEGGWFDANLIRFKNGRVQKIGGWAKDTLDTYLGKARALHAWVSLEGSKYLGVGTTWKYYIKQGTNFDDVTPIRATTSAGDVTFAATNGSSTVTITDTSHGAATNDFVTFSGAASLGGNVTATVLNQEYQILLVTGTNNYTITAKDTSGTTVTANASDSGNGGSSVVGTYQINVGLDVYVSSTGWGTGTWGASTWGSASAISASNQLRLWTHDHFGENLIMNVRGGGIYRWLENSGTSTRAVALSGITGANQVPTVGLQAITSEKDRHLIILGADPIVDSARTGSVDPMLIAFSDQENDIDFEPRSTNTAGSLRLSSGSAIIGAVKSRQEVLIWTDTALYSMQFIGPPFTFGINLINENSGLIAPKAAVTAPSGVFWMGYDNFYVYTGSVKKVPCSVLSYVFDDYNSSQTFKTHAFTNTQYDEVGWYYCSGSSDEIDRYVVYNYSENVWSYGQLRRYAWLDAGVEPYPRATENSYLYEHETGYDADGSPMTNVFVESSDFDIGDGEQFAFINRMIPDIRFLSNSDSGQVNLVLKTRNFPGDTLTTNSTSAINSSTQQSHVRARARQAVVRVESDDDNTSANSSTGWRLGATRLDVRTDGRR
tara:strand:- start:312 stop:2177 length:1866 start_codon:yes stop_codon:yes gene_type:complete